MKIRRRIPTAGLIAVTLLLGSGVQAEMINLTAEDQPDGTIPGSSCPPQGGGTNCVAAATSGSITDSARGTVTFLVDHEQPTGTGVLDPFLRVQQPNANQTNEQGYNTSGGTPLDDKPPPGVWTRDLLMADLLKVALDSGGNGYQFLLDIDEKKAGSNSLLSLDGLKLYAVNFGSSPIGEATDSNGNWVIDPTEFSDTPKLLWDMDADADNAVLLDSNRLIPGSCEAGKCEYNPPGNGTLDMRMEVPDTIITDTVVSNYKYFILWSRFGLLDPTNGGSKSTDSFEEWAARVCTECDVAPPSDVPVPAPLVLLGTGLALLGWRARRR